MRYWVSLACNSFFLLLLKCVSTYNKEICSIRIDKNLNEEKEEGNWMNCKVDRIKSFIIDRE
jgi:hypothetical protein